MAGKNSSNPIHLTELNITNAKGLQDITINLKKPCAKNPCVTCITGLNGVGKSTILHLLANAFNQAPNWEGIEPFLHNYRPNRKYYYSDFFESTKKNDWVGTRCKYTFSNGKSFELDRKKGVQRNRWLEYSKKRSEKAVFYTGLDYLATEIEVDRKQTPYNLSKSNPPSKFTDEMKKNVLKFANKIMGKKYEDLFFYEKSGKVKNFIGVKTDRIGEYTSYEMGAGERKIFYLLIWLSMLPPYSLVLIDEPEALLYSEATKELFNFFIKLSKSKHLQIICTTHWTGVKDFKKVNLFTLARASNGRIIIYRGMDAVTLQLMEGVAKKKKLLMVEDEVAELIAQEIVNEGEQGASYCFKRFGSVENVPTYTCALIKAIGKNFLMISDGDVSIKWKKGEDPSHNIDKSELEGWHVSFLPEKVIGASERKSPEYILLKYGVKGLSKKEQDYQANSPTPNSSKEEKELIYKIANLRGGNQAIIVNDMIRAFIKNHRDKWEEYTKDVKAKILSE